MTAAIVTVVLASLILVPAYLVGRLAQRRGRGFAPWFALSCVLLWPIALAALLVGEDRTGARS